MSDEDLQFEKTFKTAVVSMYINGTYPARARNKLWILQLSFIIFIFVSCFYLLSYSILAHDIRNGQFTEACKNITMLIICMNTTLKHSVLLYHRVSVGNLIDIVNKDYQLSKQFLQEEQSVVKRYAREGHLVCIFWLVCASNAVAIFPVKAFVLTARSYWMGENKLIPMFDVTFPATMQQHKDSIYFYCGIFALCLVFGFFGALMLIGFDPLIPIFTLHTCGQLDILGRRISTALSEAITIEEKKEKFKNIIIKVQELYRLINTVQTNFAILNEFSMKTTTLILPLVGFHIIEDLRINEFHFEFIILLVGALLHFLMPCYFSDLLMEKSAEFRQNIYSCGWEKYPDTSIRQTVLFMLTRASRPLSISTVFYTISLDTFSTMLRQAYAIFNLMNAAWRK